MQSVSSRNTAMPNDPAIPDLFQVGEPHEFIIQLGVPYSELFRNATVTATALYQTKAYHFVFTTRSGGKVVDLRHHDVPMDERKAHVQWLWAVLDHAVQQILIRFEPKDDNVPADQG